MNTYIQFRLQSAFVTKAIVFFKNVFSNICIIYIGNAYAYCKCIHKSSLYFIFSNKVIFLFMQTKHFTLDWGEKLENTLCLCKKHAPKKNTVVSNVFIQFLLKNAAQLHIYIMIIVILKYQEKKNSKHRMRVFIFLYIYL